MMDRGIPPVAVFNTMIDKLFKEGKVTEAQKLFDLMSRAGVKPDVISYNTMVHGYFLAGKLDEVVRLLDDMLSTGLKPNAVTFNTLINGMLSIGLKPNVATCKTLIDSYCEDSQIEDVLTLFREMLSKAAKTDTVTENIIP
jgi:pentatricopeptide repeat protein